MDNFSGHDADCVDPSGQVNIKILWFLKKQIILWYKKSGVSFLFPRKLDVNSPATRSRNHCSSKSFIQKVDAVKIDTGDGQHWRAPTASIGCTKRKKRTQIWLLCQRTGCLSATSRVINLILWVNIFIKYNIYFSEIGLGILWSHHRLLHVGDTQSAFQT